MYTSALYSLVLYIRPRIGRQVQRRRLDRLAKQLTHEVVIHEQVVNRVFAHDGGVEGLDKQLGGQPDSVIDVLAEHLWDIA